MNYNKKENVTGKTKEILDSARDFNFKDRFGTIPKSIMKFKKTEELMSLIDYDNSELGKIEGKAIARGGGYAKSIRYSIYNPDQAYFILDYYTKPNNLILDPFCGRATRPLVSLFLNRRYIGCDISKETVELNKKLIMEKMPSKKEKVDWDIINEDGIYLKTLDNKKNYIDGIFTCPPYYDIEKYGGEIGDLSRKSYSSFNKSIHILFETLYRLIKPSNYKTLEFHPVILTVGSVRKGASGLIDMDYIFQNIALKCGFILHDKLFTENLTPGAGFTFRRNYCYSYVTKNHETTLIFLKY